MTMARRSKVIKRSAAAAVGAGIVAAVMAASLGGSASADVPRRAPAQITVPPQGSGVVVVVQQPQLLGPRSFT
jgi:ABC-type Fe3+ transport system substrate-binding protein